MNSEPTPFLWLIRILASLFLLGYLAFGFLAAFILGYFPGNNLFENSIFILLLLVFLAGLYAIWSNREGVGGLLFILWYAALWPCKRYMAGEGFWDMPAPGTFMLIIGILSIIYWYKKRKQKNHAID